MLNCHNVKCKKELNGNFVMMNYGTCGTGDTFFCVTAHSNHGKGNDDPIFGNVDIDELAQFNHGSQDESYFCSKACMVQWFTDSISTLPDPGTTEYRAGE